MTAGQNATVTVSLVRVKNNVIINLSSVNGYSLSGIKAHLLASPASGNPPQNTQSLNGLPARTP